MKNTLQSNRQTEYNFDLLRIICVIAVILIHISASYKNAYTNTDAPYRIHIITTLICNTLTRFAVPCFMMLSGAFLLDNDDNRNYSFFYKKSFKKIGISTVIFSVLYFVYSEVFACFYSVSSKNYSLLLGPLKLFIKGEPFFHMWYLYTLIGVYIMIPVLIRIKHDIGEKNFERLSWCYLLVSVASGFTSSFILHWSISKSVLYVGFALVGYQIRKKTRKKPLAGVIAIGSAAVLFLLLTLIQYKHTIAGIPETEEKYSIVGHFNPIVVIASILVFYGFSKITIKSEIIHFLSKQSFMIYLFHAGVWDFSVRIFFKVMGGRTDPVYTIPVFCIFTFVVSLGLALVYNKVRDHLNDKFGVDNKISALIRL